MEQERLNLSDPILEHLPNVVPLSDEQRKAHRWHPITILHCLQHTGGWDSKVSFDPMFRPTMIAEELKVPPPPWPHDIIRYMANQPVEFPAGQRYAYSNFGYAVLGRIIEHVSGKTYEQFVQEEVFRPIGIKSAVLGKTLLKDRRPGEVLYYDADRKDRSVFAENLFQFVPTPYGGYCLEAMDSSGGWLLSAVDTIQFASSLDSSSKNPLFKPETRRLMTDCRPAGPVGLLPDGKPKSFYYGLGWNVRPLLRPGHAHLWNLGEMAGVSNLIVIRDDQIDWVIMFNSREKNDGKAPNVAIDGRMHEVVNSIKKWPTYDLFPAINRSSP